MITKMQPYNLILSGFVFIALFFTIQSRNKYKDSYEENKANISAMADSLDHFKNKNGDNVARIKTLETQNSSAFLGLETKDKEIIRLQQVVKQYKKELKNSGSVTNFSSNTSIDTMFNSEVSFEQSIDTSNYVYPIYRSAFNLEDWVQGKIEARKDGVEVSLKIRNDYSIIIGEESQGLFKKKIPFSDVINYNPYSFTTQSRTYKVSLPKVKKNGIGIMGGIDYRGRPTIVVGVTRTFFRF